MALLPHSFFPRSMFDMDQWVHSHPKGITTLDLFDPFDELDHMISRNLNWLSRPEQIMQQMMPKVPQKYRISVDVAGFSPKSIKTEVVGNKLIVHGVEEHIVEGTEDYTKREIKKTFLLPAHAETDKLVSFVTKHGHLIIEVPLKETITCPNSDLFPRILDNPDGTKNVSMTIGLPPNVDPAKAHVMIKDRDLILRVEDKVEKPDSTTKYFYYKRTTLPENTEFDKLKCEQDARQIVVSAPLNLDFARSHRHVPIEHRQKELAIEHHHK